MPVKARQWHQNTKIINFRNNWIFEYFLKCTGEVMEDHKSFAILEFRSVFNFGTSGQDRDISRYTVPPLKTKRKTTNLKIKNNQNFQKIKLYGSPTTKELKKKHSSRPVGGQEGQPCWRWYKARQQLENGEGQGSGWQTRRSHICMWINLSMTDGTGFQHGETKPENLWLKNLWRLQWQEKLPAS